MKQGRGRPAARAGTPRSAGPAVAVLVPVAKSSEPGAAQAGAEARAGRPALILLPLRPVPLPTATPGPEAPGPRWRPARGERRPWPARDSLRSLARGGRALARPFARPTWALALALVVAVQAVLSLRLAGTDPVSGAAGGCLLAGGLELAHWLPGVPLPSLASCPSGVPAGYPVLGALAAHLGGLAAARGLSLSFVLVATVLLWATASRLYGRPAGFWAATAWAFLAPVIRLGATATAGAMAVFLLALATWLAAGDRGRRAAAGWGLLAAAAAALLLANATEYGTALLDPAVAAAAALAGAPGARAAWRRHGFLVFALIVAVIAVGLVGGGQFAAGLRTLGAPGPLLPAGAWLAALAAGYGAAWLVARARRRRPQLRDGLVVGLAVALVPLAALGARHAAGGPAGAGPAAPSAAAPGPALSGAPGRYLGVFEPGGSASYRPVEQFAAATGQHPDLVMTYTNWPAAFPASFAARAYRHHAVPLLQLQPLGISLGAVGAGRYDRYLTSYADAVRAYRHPVVISFGHEMNGTWYSWGWQHTSPAAWVAAWRHVVRLFRRQGAANVTWLWSVNVTEPGLGPIRDWWPGASYVTWVGIEGYYYVPTDSFSSVFGPALADIRRLTGKPVLLAEVAAGPGAGQAAKIPGLFAGVRAARLLGLVWYDAADHGGLYHQDWRLEGDPAGLAAFRSAARGMRSG